MEKSWDIIVWTAENTIDYVPSSWANEGKTQFKYPENCNSLKIRKLIDSCAEPEHFVWLDATSKAESVKDLAMAKEMCDKGQYTSNLELSDCGTGGNKRKRRIKTRLYDTSSESSTSDDVPINSDTFNASRTCTKTDRNQIFVREKFVSPSSNGTAVHQKGNTQAKSIQPSNFRTGSCAHSEASLSGFTPHRKQDSQANSIRPSNLFSRGSCVQSEVSPSVLTGDLSKVLTELHDIKFELSENKKVLKRLEAYINTRENSQAGANFVPNEYAEKFPCKTFTELEGINFEITNTRGSFNELVNFLYLLGGSTAHKAVYLMMGKIFDRKLPLQYSGQGKKKKRPFCSLKIFEAIVAATRKSFPKESEADIKKSVALFLATAKSRLGRETLNNRGDLPSENAELDGQDNSSLY